MIYSCNLNFELNFVIWSCSHLDYGVWTAVSVFLVMHFMALRHELAGWVSVILQISQTSPGTSLSKKNEALGHFLRMLSFSYILTVTSVHFLCHLTYSCVDSIRMWKCSGLFCLPLHFTLATSPSLHSNLSSDSYQWLPCCYSIGQF